MAGPSGSWDAPAAREAGRAACGGGDGGERRRQQRGRDGGCRRVGTARAHAWTRGRGARGACWLARRRGGEGEGGAGSGAGGAASPTWEVAARREAVAATEATAPAEAWQVGEGVGSEQGRAGGRGAAGSEVRGGQPGPSSGGSRCRGVHVPPTRSRQPDVRGVGGVSPIRGGVLQSDSNITDQNTVHCATTTANERLSQTTT